MKMKFKRSYKNISERHFIGTLLKLFAPPIRLSTIDWAHLYRRMTSEESEMVGRFDCNRTPALEYVYDCLDNWQVYIVVVMKASQIGWSELTNNFLGKLIHTNPCKIMMAFPGLTLCRNYSREKLQKLIDNTKVLRDIINIGVAKESFNYFK
ncbi:MAG: phage terminase large subunit family protein, partial [Balneolaceae bacterium]